MNIKMVVTDLDDTLLRTDKSISEYTKNVFRRLRQQDILLAFATSRSSLASARFRKALAPDINITSGGSIATMGGETLFRAAIDIDTAQAIIHSLMASRDVLQIAADSEDNYFSSKPIDKSWAGWQDYAHSITTDFSRPLPVADVFKITPQAISAEAVLMATQAYPSVDVLSFTGEDWYQIKSQKAAKHLAVAAVCKRLGFRMDEIAAFGDDFNDVEMLRCCGAGVAMANAIAQAKTAADFICGGNDDDGVARWLEEHVL